jgi:hypothetical protein
VRSQTWTHLSRRRMEGSEMKTKIQTIRSCWKGTVGYDFEGHNLFHSETYLIRQEHIRISSRIWNFIIRVRLAQTANQAIIVNQQ